ncbi:peptidase T [Devosia aurantiaca]|uniref:Peptidase T n=1 Tax=Devosia aurantiaca TaxID=2714858 RepID=A0A6M1STP4_9HYPH|nr:peptidase T [Devosia aurantiaca]NGP18545.1 peptidase T [Devosia aurantiaca]
MTDTVLSRFLRYVVIDTQSDAASPSQPSTEKQKNLGRVLVEELQSIGLADAHLDEHGYVYATVPANTDKDVPVICFCSHMDTAPDFTGKDVQPKLHRDYQGGDITLGNSGRIIRTSDHPELDNQIGNDVVTTDGTTLLGADDKAGIAEIVTAAEMLVRDTSIPHGTIKLLFTPDEEIGRGVDKVDLAKLGARFAYTMDGGTAGSVEDETFSADLLTLEITGVAMHPGFAKGRMENAIKIAGQILARLPHEVSPEGTDGIDGFVHPTEVTGSMEAATVKLIVRDFKDAGLTEKRDMVDDIARAVLADFPGSSYRISTVEQYRNMKQVLDRHPEIIDNAEEAIRRAGMTPRRAPVRGGTDGSRLSFMGLPTANIFAGGHAFHSPLEWISHQDMDRAVRTIIEIAKIWEERA